MDIKKPQLVKVGAFAYFFEGVLQHPPALYSFWNRTLRARLTNSTSLYRLAR